MILYFFSSEHILCLKYFSKLELLIIKAASLVIWGYHVNIDRYLEKMDWIAEESPCI